MRSFLLLFVAVLFFTCMTPDTVGQTTPRYVTATAVKTPPVSVPREAKESGLGGEVRVGVTINSEGKVIEVGDAWGPGSVCKQATRADVIALRNAARQAALSAVFEPSTADGRPDPATATVRFDFPIGERKTGSENQIQYFSAVGEPDNFGDPRGVLNGRALSLPKPVYPPAARAVRASGAVQVAVLIDEKGEMFSAEPVSGHPLLRHAASTAACSAKFTPTLLEGRRVRVAGIITYNFVP